MKMVKNKKIVNKFGFFSLSYNFRATIQPIKHKIKKPGIQISTLPGEHYQEAKVGDII